MFCNGSCVYIYSLTCLIIIVIMFLALGTTTGFSCKYVCHGGLIIVVTWKHACLQGWRSWVQCLAVKNLGICCYFVHGKWDLLVIINTIVPKDRDMCQGKEKCLPANCYLVKSTQTIWQYSLNKAGFKFI